MNKAEMDKAHKEYRVEDDLRTLIEAEKIKKDSKRFKAAMAKRKERMELMENIKKES